MLRSSWPAARGPLLDRDLWEEQSVLALPDRHRLASTTVRWPELQSERFLVSRMDPGPDIQDYVVQHLAGPGHHPTIQSREVGRR